MSKHVCICPLAFAWDEYGRGGMKNGCDVMIPPLVMALAWLWTFALYSILSYIPFAL